MKIAAVLVVALACSRAFASDPGQPLDCSDWEPAVAGITCRESVAMPCTDSEGQVLVSCGIGNPTVTDNDGYSYYLTYQREFPVTCFVETSLDLVHAVVRRVRDGVDEVVGRFKSHCGVTEGQVQKLRWSHDCSISTLPRLTFDPSRGSVQVGVCSYCDQENGNLPACSLQPAVHRVALEGLTTIFELEQSYVPSTSSLGFRVPYMPEGMAGADHFDTYWGNLAHPIDFTQAHPLRCGYPVTPPHVGDYLTVADTVSTPAPGEGVYYVTAATYEGATRYGRKRTNGHMSGRDPALLPACVASGNFPAADRKQTVREEPCGNSH